jgi:hypothetical protein
VKGGKRNLTLFLCYLELFGMIVYLLKKTIMISQQLYDKLYELANLRRITYEQAKELQQYIQEHINPRYSVCLRCSQQLKHGQRLVTNYLSQVEVIESFAGTIKEETLMDEIMPMVPELEVDEVEADKVGCTKCKRKKENKG